MCQASRQCAHGLHFLRLQQLLLLHFCFGNIVHAHHCAFDFIAHKGVYVYVQVLNFTVIV